jgi:hypothetical protein
MDFIILADSSDETAIRVAVLLRQRHGSRHVELRTVEELLFAHWEHRVSNRGITNRIRLHDGTLLPDSNRTVVFNRLTAIEPRLLENASSANQEYARIEAFALLLSWLAGFGRRVLNPPSPSGLSGSVHRPLIWQQQAVRAGLRGADLAATTSTRRFPPSLGAVPRPDIDRISDPYAQLYGNNFMWYSKPLPNRRTSVLVIGDRVIGEVPEGLAPPCRRLAKLSGVSLLRIDFAHADSAPAELVFIGADPCPVVTDSNALLSLVEFLEGLAASDEEAAHP